MTDPGVPSLLKSTREPWLLEFPETPGQAYERAWAAANAGVLSRVARGWKMTHLDGFYSELAAALQFPDYFGENPAAVAECLTDLSWMPADAYLLVVVDAMRLLEGEPDDSFEIFVDVLVEAARQWAEPVTEGEAWDRPAVPFHVLFQAEPAESEALRARFARAGQELAAWEVEPGQ
jgi:RNAse (barnase) inhibitor barstar